MERVITPQTPIKQAVKKVWYWTQPRVDLEAAIDGIPAQLRGERPHGLPYSAWQLLEHIRRTQADILEFCRNPRYVEPDWQEHWPSSAEPPSAEAWDESMASCRRDLEAIKVFMDDPALDLFATIREDSGQTYLRIFLHLADHNAYHIGQLVMLRRLLGIWPSNTTPRTKIRPPELQAEFMARLRQVESAG